MTRRGRCPLRNRWFQSHRAGPMPRLLGLAAEPLLVLAVSLLLCSGVRLAGGALRSAIRDSTFRRAARERSGQIPWASVLSRHSAATKRGPRLLGNRPPRSPAANEASGTVWVHQLHAQPRRDAVATGLTQSPQAPPMAKNNASKTTRFAPKVIWMMWLQGEDHLLQEGPEINRVAYQAWKQINPDWQLVLLTDTTLEDWLPGLREEVGVRTAASFSDLARLRLITKHGGVWADMSLVPMKPLSTVIDGLVNDMGSFAFKFGLRRATQKPKILETYFLAARGPGNYVMSRWLELYEKRYRHTQPGFQYFQCHFEMVKLYSRDDKVHSMVDQMTDVPVAEPETYGWPKKFHEREPNKRFFCPRRGVLCPDKDSYAGYALGYKRPMMDIPMYNTYIAWVLSTYVADKLPRLEHPIISA